MAIEDHPAFAEWDAALKDYIEAYERYKSAIGTKEEAAAKRDLAQAQERLDRARDRAW